MARSIATTIPIDSTIISVEIAAIDGFGRSATIIAEDDVTVDEQHEPVSAAQPWDLQE